MDNYRKTDMSAVNERLRAEAARSPSLSRFSPAPDKKSLGKRTPMCLPDGLDPFFVGYRSMTPAAPVYQALNSWITELPEAEVNFVFWLSFFFPHPLFI